MVPFAIALWIGAVPAHAQPQPTDLQALAEALTSAFQSLAAPTQAERAQAACADAARAGTYDRAVPLCRSALEVAEAQHDPDHPTVTVGLNNLASMLKETGQLREAETLFRRGIARAESSLGAEHPVVAQSLNNLAGLLLVTGRLTEAEALYRRAVAIGEAELGPDHPEVATYLGHLAAVFKAAGRYAEAEALFRRALAIDEAALGRDHPSVGTDLNNLASLFRATGRDAEAEPLYRRAIVITEGTLGHLHPILSVYLVNLGSLLIDAGRFDEAERPIRRAASITETSLGSDHPSVGAPLNNLGRLLAATNRHAEATSLFRRAIAIMEASVGPDHPDVGTFAAYLGESLEATGEAAEAEVHYRRALTIAEDRLGLDHPDVAKRLHRLSSLVEATGRIDEAAPLFRRALAVEEADLARNLLVGTPADRSARLAQFTTSTSNAISWHLQRNPTDPDAAALAMTTWVRRKGRLEALERSLLATARADGDPEVVGLLEALQTATAELGAIRNRGPGPRDTAEWQETVRALADERANLQRQLADASPRARRVLQPVALTDIAATLPASTRLVELATYQPYDPTTRVWGEPRYAAYVLDPDGSVTGTDLGAVADVDWPALELRTAILRRDPIGAKAKAMHAAIFGGIDLSGVTHLFLSTDGRLALVPFEVILSQAPNAPTASYLGSGRDRLQPPANGSAEKSVVVFDVDYGAGPKWKPLTHTRAEGRAVRRALGRARSITKTQATEAALTAVTRPQVLHIASHGFLDAASETPRDLAMTGLRDVGAASASALPAVATTAHPMLRSAIVLAGANVPTEDDDGLLTAGELATVDLRGTRLVTLSACGTAEGELRTGDGVYGLRRGLVLAGTQAQVLSLWKVDDEATAFLMNRFYRALGKGASVTSALETAKHAVRQRPNWQHPFYWAAFTVSGDPLVTVE